MKFIGNVGYRPIGYGTDDYILVMFWTLEGL